MNKKYPTIFILLTLTIMSACGPAPTPTIGPADVQTTAIALAWTNVAQTQAALPTATATNTPVPPTETPIPTDTPVPPTFAPQIPTIAANATDETALCNSPVPPKTTGVKVQVNFVNKTDGTVKLSFGLTQKNSVGECGTYNFTIGAHREQSFQVLAGCYWAFGIVDGRKPSTARSAGDICVTDPGVVKGITITSELIGFD